MPKPTKPKEIEQDTPTKDPDASVWTLALFRSHLTHPFVDKHLGLTEKEQKVATFAAYGLTNAEIAVKLAIPETTVVNDLYRAKKKLGVTKNGLTTLLVKTLAELAECEWEL